MQLDRKTTLVFQKKILSWYATNRRDLPWRRTRDPYKILVSEVMLQQTQVSRVIPKYEAWLEAFPTLETLAGASRRDILAMWSGLGYNRRALNLQKAAETINELRIKNNELRKKEDKFSYWPKTVEELKKLPGVGAYTARAVACFAFDQQIAVVDTNVRKVILLEVAKGTEEPKGTKEVQKMADELLPKGKASDWNQALMDYAALVLKDKKVPLKKQSR
ncbi:MAG: hypothetical protein Q8Q49_04115, partial [bacterium]|nr:hypothetical protein [bacterium]